MHRFQQAAQLQHHHQHQPQSQIPVPPGQQPPGYPQQSYGFQQQPLGQQPLGQPPLGQQPPWYSQPPYGLQQPPPGWRPPGQPTPGYHQQSYNVQQPPPGWQPPDQQPSGYPQPPYGVQQPSSGQQLPGQPTPGYHQQPYYSVQQSPPDVLKPTERQLMIELHNTVASNWHAIGTYLEIPGGQLNIIADRQRDDPQKCLMDMLSGWLQRINPPASWPDIAEAVEFTGSPDIAQIIRQKYCSVAQASYQPRPPHQLPTQTTLPQPHPANPSAPRYWQQQPPFQSSSSAQNIITPDSSQSHQSSSVHAPQQLPVVSHDFFPTQDRKLIVPDGGREPFECYEAYPPGAITEVKLSFATVHPDTCNKPSDNHHRERYEMRSRPHGIAVIINNEEFENLSTREGTDIDEKNLIQTFRYLGYTVEVHREKSSQQIIDIFEDIRKRDHSKYDSFVCCVLTHGRGKGIFGCDDKLVQIETISSKMNGKACPTLAGKPKMFFIQACRGKKKDRVTTDSDENEHDPFLSRVATDSDEKIPIESDFFFGYATPLNYVAYRDMDNGSWYVIELCRVLCTYSTRTTLGDMHKRINNEVSSRYRLGSNKQISEVRETLNKSVYFLC